MQKAGVGPQSWVAGRPYSPAPSSTGDSTDHSLDSWSSSLSGAAHRPVPWPQVPSARKSIPTQSSKDEATAGRSFGLQDQTFDLYTPSSEMMQHYSSSSRKWLPWSRSSSAEEYDIEMGLPCPQQQTQQVPRNQLPRVGKVN